MGYVPFFAFVFVSWPSLEEDWPFEGSACDDRIAGVAGKQAAGVTLESGWTFLL